jgi:uracil-DNA glycosylase
LYSSSTCSSGGASAFHHRAFQKATVAASARRPPQNTQNNYHTASITMMPEGPEVRNLVDDLAPAIGKCRLIDIRFVSGRYSKTNPPDGFRSFAQTMTPFHPSSTTKSTTTATMPNQQYRDWFDKLMDDYKDETANFHDEKLHDANESACTNTVTANPEAVDVITDWNCKGKFIYILLDRGSKKNNAGLIHSEQAVDDDDDYQRSIWITLGMSGRFLSAKVLQQLEASGQSTHVRWYMELYNFVAATNQPMNEKQPTTSTTKIYYSDPRSFGTLKFCLSRQMLSEKLHSLGPDILTSCTEIDFLNVMDAQKNPEKKNICKFLVDQSNISGIGNYILAEGLYRAMIDPFASIQELDTTMRQKLFREIQAVAKESYQSLKKGNDNDDDFEFQCYGQEVCKRYGYRVQRETSGPHGRTIWYVDQQLFRPRNQRLPLPPTSSSSVSVSTRTPSSNRDSPNKNKNNKRSIVSDMTTEGGESASLESIPVVQNGVPESISKRIKPVASSRDRTSPQQDVNPRLATNTPGNAKLAAILDAATNQYNFTGIMTEPLYVTTTNAATPDSKKLTVMQELNSSALAASLLDGIQESRWKETLREPLQNSESFQQLALFLEEERLNGITIFPPRKEIFQALNLCPLESTKVVILGQDPYHGVGQGHGLAFSVRKRVRPPPSLLNIFKEAIDDVGIQTPQHGNLEYWARQGVLLLNAVLTVQQGKANSHKNKGWEKVTDMIIQELCSWHESRGGSLVFLLWGNYAAEKVDHVIDTDRHTIIQSSHPSPLGATKTTTPFIGSKCFSRANAALQEMDKDPIDWNVEP